MFLEPLCGELDIGMWRFVLDMLGTCCIGGRLSKTELDARLVLYGKEGLKDYSNWIQWCYLLSRLPRRG